MATVANLAVALTARVGQFESAMKGANQTIKGLQSQIARLEKAGAANTVAVPPIIFDLCYTDLSTNTILESARQETFAILGENWRTPTIIVNGVIVEELSLEGMISAIDAALDQVNQ